MKHLGYDPINYLSCHICRDHIAIRDGEIISVNTPLSVGGMNDHTARDWMTNGTCNGCKLIAANYAGSKLLQIIARLNIADTNYINTFRWSQKMINEKWKELNSGSSTKT